MICADVAEDVRGERLRTGSWRMYVSRDLHARELALVLDDVVDLIRWTAPARHRRRAGRVRCLIFVEDLWQRDVQRSARAGAARRSGPASAGRRARSGPRCRPRSSTSRRPLRSRIGPRGASSARVRSWLSCAAAAVLVAGEHLERPEPEEEDREDAERDGAEDRRPAARVCGVSRYGSSTRGSGGRKRSGRRSRAC